jgi:hypothetical protein
MIVKSLKITGNGTVQQLSVDTRQAKWLLLKPVSTNGSAILVGGVEVSASPAVGYPINPADQPTFLTDINDKYEFYPFSKLYVYVANNDVLNVLYGIEGSNT